VRPFHYIRATDTASATSAGQGAAFVAGGTSLVDLMRLDVMRPETVVDISRLPLTHVDADGEGVRIGALAKNTDVAVHPLIAKRFPVLAEALLSGASPQLRNMATVGGNLLQRTRCPYFRDVGTSCNKREPGAGCSAIGGVTRSHAVLGTSGSCIATHPSDMCVALIALDAVVHTTKRAIPMADLHTLPGAHPEIEHVLAPGELITEVSLPASRFAARSHYVKVRDRASFAFALASAAVAIDLTGRTIREARVALGGVATKPWRSQDAEAELAGRTATRETFQRAANAALAPAKAHGENAFKIELARRTIVRALEEVVS
jgi:xanthine dehydrogenase YagS FAD-binding subunit